MRGHQYLLVAGIGMANCFVSVGEATESVQVQVQPMGQGQQTPWYRGQAAMFPVYLIFGDTKDGGVLSS
jgi:hypothetical protein